MSVLLLRRLGAVCSGLVTLFPSVLLEVLLLGAQPTLALVSFVSPKVLIKVCGIALCKLAPYRELRQVKAINMKGYVVPIEKETRKNADFRRVLYTGKHSQLVLMSLKPGEEIGEETHKTVDQFFRFEGGEGKVIIDGVDHPVKDGDAVIAPAGARHNVINTSKKSELKLYTIYSPPEHQDKIVRHTKAEAIASPEEFDGRTTE